MRQEIIICACHSIEHQLSISYEKGDTDNDFDEMDLEIHLTTSRRFWGRVIGAIKYIFGHKSRYGDWDVFTIDSNDCDKLIAYLQALKNNREKIKENFENGVK